MVVKSNRTVANAKSSIKSRLESGPEADFKENKVFEKIKAISVYFYGEMFLILSTSK